MLNDDSLSLASYTRTRWVADQGRRLLARLVQLDDEGTRDEPRVSHGVVHEAHHLAQEPPPFLVSTLGKLFTPTLSLLVDPAPGLRSLEKKEFDRSETNPVGARLGVDEPIVAHEPKELFRVGTPQVGPRDDAPRRRLGV